jgi:PBSX family phage terminase large subunit
MLFQNQNQPTPSIKPIAVFNPLPWQVAPWRDTSLVMLLTGSAGGGKSRLAAEKVHGYCLHYPGATGLALRKTRESMTNSTVLMLEKQIINNDPRVHHAQDKYRFEYSNGSILAYGGMNDPKQREQVRSIGQEGGVGICWMEEANAFIEPDFNEVLPRMRAPAAPWRQVILTTNPDAPAHWIHKRLIIGGEASVYLSGAADNTHNPSEYVATLQKLTGVQKQRLAGGLWVQAEGVVYEQFDATIHVIEKAKLPAIRRNIAAVDWGFTNPGVIHVWGVDGDGRMYLVHEVYQTRRVIDFWIDKARQIQQTYMPDVFVCDPAEPAYIAQFQSAGVHAVPAFNDIAPGINAVQQRLQVAGDGKPRLFVCREALESTDERLAGSMKPVGLLDEIGVYTWPKGADGKPVKEVPVDDNNHACDTMRYAVTYLDNTGMQQAHVDSGFYVLIAGR